MAFFKGSYYEAVPLFTENADGDRVFPGLRTRPLAAPEPVLEHGIALKDRLDSVAMHYYAESRDWRRIAEANPHILFPEDLLYSADPVEENGRERIGELVLIPKRRDSA